MRSALWLVVTLVASALAYLALGASFLAGAQVVVYVGAIVILVLFAIMLLRLKEDALDRRAPPQAVIAAAVGACLAAALVPALRFATAAAPAPAGYGTVQSIGRMLLGPALLPFEIISLLLLAAMVAAIVLGRKDAR